MKYITVKDEYGDRYAVLFDELLTHVGVAGTQRVYSAGYCDVRNGVVLVWGRSASLNVPPMEGDEKLILEAVHRRI